MDNGSPEDKQQRQVWTVWVAIVVVYALLIIGLFGCHSSKSSQPKQQPQPQQPIEIRGTHKFQHRTALALTLLKNRANHAWQKARSHIRIIEQGQHSAMWAYEHPPRLEINDTTAFHSLTWYAGVIAHESIHAELYYGHKANYGSSVPKHIWSGQEAEQSCIQYQINVLRQIQAPQHEIRYLTQLDGTHCDIDNDGDCDWNDYLHRQW